MPMAGLPEGTLTFLLTDLVASTRAWEAAPAGMRQAMARHDRIVAVCLEQNGGVGAGRAGDSVLAVFRRAGDAAACALGLQREFRREPWPPGIELRTRIALHSGEAQLRQGEYHGVALNRCARLLATAHGGQVLVTRATEQLLVDDLPKGTALWDLGLHGLKDLTRPEHVFQLVDLDHPEHFPPIRSLQHQLTNLPAQLTPFIGRDDELKQLRDMHHRARLLTLTGPGGAGKTRLALQLASDLIGEHADGVWLVELDPLSDPLLVPQAVAGGLGLTEQPGRRLADTLLDHARQRHLLLVLDNCEHVVDTAAELTAELLKGCEGLTVLATSREPLKVPGELTWQVPPLSRNEAVRLFADRAGARDQRFRLTDETVEVVANICQRLDYIPLAIELAAARVTVMPLGQILGHLESRFSFLTGGNRTTAGRLRTLQAAMDWSYDFLGDNEKVLFRRLSIFAGRFSLEAAEAVCSDTALPPDSVLGQLAQLVDKSLVMLDEGRYRCLETIRAYGRERLREVSGLDALHGRVGAYLVALAKAREPGRLSAWLNGIEAVHDDTSSTLTWAVGADPELGIRLAVAVYIYWQLRGHAAEPRQFVGQLVDQLPPGPMHAAALHLAGSFAYLQADFSTASRLLGEALEEARAAGDQGTVLQTLERMGLLATAVGQLSDAEIKLGEALSLARELGEREAEGGILQQLGILASQRQDLAGSRLLFEQSIAVRRATGRSDEASISLTFLAAVALLQGDVDTARRCVVEGLEIGRELTDRRAAWSLEVLACLAALEGLPERALQLAGAGSAMHQASGNTPPEAWDRFQAAFLQPARSSLGTKAATTAWDAGREMDFDEALEFALSKKMTERTTV